MKDNLQKSVEVRAKYELRQTKKMLKDSLLHLSKFRSYLLTLKRTAIVSRVLGSLNQVQGRLLFQEDTLMNLETLLDRTDLINWQPMDNSISISSTPDVE